MLISDNMLNKLINIDAKISNLNPGDKIDVNVLKPLGKGVFLIDINGKQFKVSLKNSPELGVYKALVLKAGSTVSLKLLQNNEAVLTKELGLNPGDKIDVNVLKPLGKGVFLVDINGKQFKVSLKNSPEPGVYKALVLKAGPTVDLELLHSGETFSAKLPALKLLKNLLLKTFSRGDTTYNIDKLTPENIRNMVKNSGVFFENKIMHAENIEGDLKYNAMLQNADHTIDAITKLQLINILSGSYYGFFKSDNYCIKDGNIIFRKEKSGYVVYIRLELTNLGETIVIISEKNKKIKATIRTTKDISKILKGIKMPHTAIDWKPLIETDSSIFSIKDIIGIDDLTFEILV